MKKILTCVAMALLLAGCAKQYDDSGIKERIGALETRVTALEVNIASLQSALGQGVFVAKVQEYADPETGKTIGVTVTYTNGDVKYFEISPKADYAGPVLGVITSGSGNLVWAVDGQAILVSGKEIPVYLTPVFSIDEDGNLLVSIDGSDPVVIGQVQNEGATLVDGIFTDIKVEQDKLVLTLSDGSKVNVPFAKPFQLLIENKEYVYEEMGTITIPYTVSGATENTVVGVTGYLPVFFTVEVTKEAIKITPLNPAAQGHLLAYADSRTGLTSIVDIVIEPEMAIIAGETTGSYIADSDGDTFEIPVVSNVDIEAVVEAGCDWIHIVGTKAPQYNTLSVKVDENTTGEERAGDIYILKKGTEKMIQFIEFYQPAAGIGPKDLSKKGSANCYIVTAKGDYMFPAVKGNSKESVGTVNEAAILWETVNTDTAPEAGSIISDVDFEDGYVIFTATGEPGNALIAAKDADGVILWSWHIWVPDSEITTVVDQVIFGADAIMDRNLGALVAAPAADVAPVESFGLFYEWGRKDPFPGHGAVGSDGAAALAGTQMTTANGTLTIAQAIQSPTLYIWNANDWCDAADANTKLWDKTKTIYDPCPVGYVVPTRNGDTHFWGSTELNLLDAADNFVNNGATFFSLSIGTETPVVFPYAGYVDNDNGSHYRSGKRTAIWSSYSSTVGKAYARDLRDDSNTFKRSELKNARAASVRCVAEAVAE